MYIAIDGNGKRISIENVDNRTKYFCPSCLQELDIRRGQIRQHHFAHKRNTSNCNDTWINRKGNYDEPNTWHHDWQLLFPAENQEITLAFGDIKHRGDVVVNDTVIEFQHSPLSHEKFDERTNYYHSCECKVIWVFDLIEDFTNGEIYETKNGFIWKNPKRTFDYFDSITGNIDLFFQLIENKEEKCLVKISKISGKKYDRFEISNWYSKEDFFNYIGQKDGKFPLPNIIKIDQNPKYLEFKKRYNLQLNEQQERSLQHIDGATMLLAVPGSGKTTTLISRIGYMTKCLDINPSKILAITYTKKAAEEMCSRFERMFLNETNEKVNFKTINSICNEIIRRTGINYKIINDLEQRKILSPIYQNLNFEYPIETDYMNMSSEISYVKNMMFNENDINEYKWNTKNFKLLFIEYNQQLKTRNCIDYDDQLTIAYDILTDINNNVLNEYHNKYEYICVDEAQDTSKVQHEIIKLLVQKSNNIFMVGDEDQSIYGYRGAYPQALFNFKNEYKNPYVRKLEINYRSNSEIVEVANDFINRSPNRLSKKMKSYLGCGGQATCICVENRIEQYYCLLDEIKDKSKDNIAILYRNNDSAIPLIDLFERNNIDYSLNKANNTFFSNRVLTDIKNYFKFSLDLENKDLLLKIYNKNHLYLNRKMVDNACSYSDNRKTPLLDELKNQSCYEKYYLRENVKLFIETLKKLSKAKPSEAIKMIINLGYDRYINKKALGLEKLELIQMLAEKEETIESFLERIDNLENKVINKINNSENGGITLSTIHSCKGMEFDSVYIIDAINGILPSRKSINLRLEEKFGEYEEERRLMYVAMTRAKHNLFILKINSEETEFISQLLSFPNNIYCELKTRKKPKIEEIIIEEETNRTDDSLIGNDKTDIVEVESDKHPIQEREEIEDSEEDDEDKLTTIANLYFGLRSFMIVEDIYGNKYKVRGNPNNMIKKYHGKCYGEPYGPGQDPKSIPIANHNKPIWKKIF